MWTFCDFLYYFVTQLHNMINQQQSQQYNSAQKNIISAITIIMFKPDIQKLKNCLKEHRSSRSFQSEFASLLDNAPTIPGSTISEEFAIRFPRLTQLKEEISRVKGDGSGYQNGNSVVDTGGNGDGNGNMTNQGTNLTVGTTKSQGEILGGQGSGEINREDQEFWRKHKANIHQTPLKDQISQISLIVESMKQLQKQFGMEVYRKDRTGDTQSMINIHEKLYRIYASKGGKRGPTELKEKIQADVVFLVKRELRKKKKRVGVGRNGRGKGQGDGVEKEKEKGNENQDGSNIDEDQDQSKNQ